MLAQLGHEALAEAHDFHVGLALRVEVGAALAAADRQTCQGVLEDLLKAEELDDALVDGRMETQTALVRTDRAVELDAEAAVDLNLALVIHPRHAELDDALRLDDLLEHAGGDVLRMLLNNRLKGLEDFHHCLMELRLTRVALLDGFKKACKILVLKHGDYSFKTI